MSFLLNKKRGASTVEYGLFLGLIAILLISSVSAIGGNLSQLFGMTEDAMGNAVEDAAGTPTSCADIQKNRPSAASGEYTITPEGSSSVTVYCDMDTAGGPWVQLAFYDASEDASAIPGFSSGEVTFTTNYATVNLPAGWYTPFSWIDTGSNVVSLVADSPISWTDTRIELSGITYSSADGFYVADRSSLEVTYVDGYSLTYGASGSRQHIYTIETHPPMTDTSSAVPGFIGSDYLKVPNNNTDYGAATFSKTITKTKSAGADPVELRLMLDQSAADEQIGFTRYVVLVK